MSNPRTDPTHVPAGPPADTWLVIRPSGGPELMKKRCQALPAVQPRAA